MDQDPNSDMLRSNQKSHTRSVSSGSFNPYFIIDSDHEDSLKNNAQSRDEGSPPVSPYKQQDPIYFFDQPDNCNHNLNNGCSFELSLSSQLNKNHFTFNESKAYPTSDVKPPRSPQKKRDDAEPKVPPPIYSPSIGLENSQGANPMMAYMNSKEKRIALEEDNESLDFCKGAKLEIYNSLNYNSMNYDSITGTTDPLFSPKLHQSNYKN